MYREGFSFNGKHLVFDFDCYISECNISPPEKKQIRETVPYMSGYYDFSSLYGSPAFEDRTITYKVDVVGRDIREMNLLKTEMVNWLMACGRKELKDDSIDDFHFLAECVGISEEESGEHSELTIEFIAYPFKISDNLTKVVYSPSNSKKISLPNRGYFDIVPKIACNESAYITVGSNTYILPQGETESYLFKLSPGENSFTVESTGTVTFEYRIEVL